MRREVMCDIVKRVVRKVTQCDEGAGVSVADPYVGKKEEHGEGCPGIS